MGIWVILGFLTGCNRATFWDKGTACQNPGRRTGRYEISTAVLSVPRDKTGQSRKGHSKTGTGSSKTEKDVLKQERIF